MGSTPPFAAPLVSTSGMATTIIPAAVAWITDGGVSAAPVNVGHFRPEKFRAGAHR